MFDPSKLDLDLDSTNENTSDKKQEKNSNENTSEPTNNINSQNNKKESNPSDVLDNLKSSEEKENTENKSVMDEFKNPLLEKNDEKEKQETKNTNNNQEIGRTEYEKSIINKKEIEEKNKKQEEKEEKIIFDINLTSIDILLLILVDKEYDFATFEPIDIDSAVKVTFRKDKIVKEIRYIKFPIYSNILIKAKTLTKLTVDETENVQEWSWEKIIRNKNFKIITKVVPGDIWPKLFIKTSYIKKKIAKKEVKKTSVSQIMWFLWAITFIALIIWWGFIGFIVLNAKTIEDVKFFYSLWINLNQINSFISQAIAIIFSILLFIETIFLIIYLFKFSLTKKEFKQKKIRLWIISTIILILTFSTASVWMIIDRKIKSLPNWQEMAYWDIQLFDNSKLLSDSFDKQWALLEDTSDLIWPVEIKFDLSFYAKKEEQKWFKIKKYTWDFWDWTIEEKTTPIAIHKFNKKWNHKISLILEKVDLQGKIIEKEMAKIPDINISYVVQINEKKLNSWWKLIDFDASSIKELWKIEWYFIDNLDKPIWTWDIFKVWKPIFEETLIWMYIKRKDKTSDKLDKVFVITWEEKVNLSWEIKYTRSVLDDLSYEIKLTNLKNDFWNWYIEQYKWIIWDKEITKSWDITNPEKASTINFKFKSYWEHKVKVILKNSVWETKTISTIIKVNKNLKLSRKLEIFNDWKLLQNIEYDSKLNEYYINEIRTPTSLKLDARFIKADNTLYSLNKVDWDYNSDWDIDESSKIWKYDVNTEWSHKISVYYTFTNKKIDNKTIKLKEQIFIEGIKKDAIIDFKIIKKSNYAPTIVGFDASTSKVKDKNIVKYIWDYWDWITEEGDSVVQWHKYTESWTYKVTVKIITADWSEYLQTKKLVLNKKPQTAKIKASMYSAPTFQEIDFSSDGSEWQIVWYFWDFWDGNVSTEANPSHAYKKPWEYKVTLKVDFSNKNTLSTDIKVTITK